MSSQFIRTKPIPRCPDCGGWMVLRTPKSDQEWPPFWGCSRFPNCKGTLQIQSDGTPETDFIDEEE